jgi:hypothetical protein
VSRLAIQIVFVLLLTLWIGFSLVSFFLSAFSDCFDDQLCIKLKNVSAGLIFWRWLAGCLILFGAYRFFRKDPE